MINYAVDVYWRTSRVWSSSACLTLYQPVSARAVMSSYKPIKTYMDVLILGIILEYTVSASVSCFLWSVKGYIQATLEDIVKPTSKFIIVA